VEVNDDTPFTRPVKALADSRLALVTTAGLHLRDDRPFEEWESAFRAIPSDVRHADLLQSHTSIGFDRTLAVRDINVVFPIDRLRELTKSGVLSELAPTFYSFLGAQKDPARIRDETAPIVAERLRDERVDLVLLTPT
jgi:D-proline reductase (dithiol) PrdB